MGTQRLDFCSFSNLEVPVTQPAKPVGFSIIDRSTMEAKANCALRRNVCVPLTAMVAPTERWEKMKCSKRLLDHSSSEESCANRSKRVRGSSLECSEVGEFLSNPLVDFYLSQGAKPNPMISSATFSIPLAAADVQITPSSSTIPMMPNENWVDSAITEHSGHADNKDEVATIKNPMNSNSNSDSSSSNTRSSTHQEGDFSERGTGHGSELPCQSEGTEEGVENIDAAQGLQIVDLLVSCTEAISTKNIALVNHYISKLGELASPTGTTICRVAAYFTEGMALRVAKLWPHIFKIGPRDLEPAEEQLFTAFRLLNNVSPIPKFLQFTANEMILRAFKGKDKVHIIDFDIKQGLQWPTLFQSLVSRPDPPSHVRITGIGESKQELQDTGDRLAGFAEAMHLPFEFHAVVDRLEDVRLWMLHVKENESVAVNCMMQMHKLLNDVDGSTLRDFLGLIHSVRPTSLVIAEQESSHNGSHWEDRFCSSLNYYSAVFDSLDASLPQDSAVRAKIEEMFATEIRNIVACEGSERIERHETFHKWKRVLEEGGFRCLGVSDREMMQGKMLLKMFSCENYRLMTEQGGGLTLCWSQQPLFTVSAWAVSTEMAGNSSSFSQPE